MTVRLRGCSLAGLAAALLLAVSVPASAQYFGQNKVSYKKFDFRVLATPHFNIYYYPEEQAGAEQVARLAERWHSRLSALLDHELSGKQPIVLYASQPDFEQTNVVEGIMGEGTGGVTEGLARRVVIPMGVSLRETDHVLGHELVHAYQYDILGPAAGALPLWFMEGMAEDSSLGADDPQTAMWLRDAALDGNLPTLGSLDNPKYFPYRFGHAFWAYIDGRWSGIVGRVLNDVADASSGQGPGDPIEAVENESGVDRKALSSDWQAAILKHYNITPGKNAAPSKSFLAGKQETGQLNVGPALSPDGSMVAFLSSRNRLSIDLYLADVASGRITEKLISTETDPHFDSLQFIASGGAWDPAGQRLAIATLRTGRPVLAIVDAPTRAIQREIRFDDLDQVLQPAWSPDGQRIAFTAQVNGFTDLFVYDLTTSKRLRLTEGPAAELQPSWSPDGRQLVFVTDRFSSSMDTLDAGAYQLATIPSTGGDARQLSKNTTGDALNPQWAGDDSIYCISTGSGRPEVYRVDADRRTIERLTNIETGIAGITPLSPAISLSADSRHVATTTYRHGGFDVDVLSTDSLRPGTPVADTPPANGDGTLPPMPRQSGALEEMLHAPAQGLPADASSFEQKPYRGGLRLVGLTPTAGFTESTGFGVYFSGGISFLFSDVLGNHQLATAVAVNGSYRDIAATVQYLDRTHRWNWGVFGGRVPLFSGSVTTSSAVAGNQPVFVQQTESLRQTYDEVGMLTAYPLNRSTRIEFSGSFAHIGFSNEVRTDVFSAFTGELLDSSTAQLPSPETISIASVGAALIRDTAVMGGTSPILGSRWHLEAAPTFGGLTMTTVTADLRKYVMPVRPVTLAGRVLHAGRYGRDSEDARLTPLFLGDPALVRGYDVGTFGPTDCIANATSSCPLFDRLVGSRFLVLNGEVRAPLLGLFKHNIQYGPVPIEVFAFGDTGVAWSATTTNRVSNGFDGWVTSAGVGLRVNMFGFAIGEFNAARTLTSPHTGWHFVFNLRPGY